MKEQESGIRHQESECRILDVALKRLRWRCRRGLLELDIVLGRFVETHYAQLDDAGKRAFDDLLDMPDNRIWDMIAGRLEAAPGAQQALLARIRAL